MAWRSSPRTHYEIEREDGLVVSIQNSKFYILHYSTFYILDSIFKIHHHLPKHHAKKRMQDYPRPLPLFNRHIETIFPALFRKIPAIEPTQERISTPDNDFLDLDWYKPGGRDLVIISHGLEGNTKRGYIKGMAEAFIKSGFDALAWNYRGCSGEMNLTERFYHSGATYDLDTVIDHAAKKGHYKKIHLIGFSLGGNITLKYLGENHPSSGMVSKAVAISVPLDLESSCHSLSSRENWLYERRFLKSLKKKVKEKSFKMKLPNIDRLDSIHKIREFDDYITGPLHGFKDASDYYSKCSSLNFLGSIKTPTLIINALNDPFLSQACFPEKVSNNQIKLSFPKHGGHVGFTLFNGKNLYWSEIQALEFVANDPE